jgi:hypothetical protein
MRALLERRLTVVFSCLGCCRIASAGAQWLWLAERVLCWSDVLACRCDPSRFDGYWKDEVSLTELHRFQVGTKTSPWSRQALDRSGYLIPEFHFFPQVNIIGHWRFYSCWLEVHHFESSLSGHHQVPAQDGLSAESCRLCLATSPPPLWPSLLMILSVQATPHPNCRLRVTVLPESNSPDGGTKVKLVGVMVSEGFSAVDALGIQLDQFAGKGRGDGHKAANAAGDEKRSATAGERGTADRPVAAQAGEGELEDGGGGDRAAGEQGIAARPAEEPGGEKPAGDGAVAAA